MDGVYTSYYQRGSLDLYVQGIPNEELFALCRTLRDVGCGFYPNNRFVHVDVHFFGARRRWNTVLRIWETPSKYVDGWPGVLEAGMGWMGAQGG